MKWEIDRVDLPGRTVDAGHDLKVTALRAIDLAAKVKVTVLSVHQQKNSFRLSGMA